MNLDQLSSLSLLSTTILFTYFDFKRYNNLLTPFSVAIIPIAIISIIDNFIFVDIGILPVSFHVNLFIIAISIFIWFGNIVSTNRSNHIENINFLNLFKPYRKYQFILTVISVLIFIITFLKAINIINSNGGILYLASHKFEEDMTKGFVAHLNVFGQAIFVWLFLVTKVSTRKFFSYMGLFLLGISNFLLMVKYNLFWIILMAFFISNIGLSPKIQIKKSLKTILFLTILFLIHFIVVIYYGDSFSHEGKKTTNLLFSLILNYFMSGPIVLDIWLKTPEVIPDWGLLLIFKNIYNIVIGSPLRYQGANVLSTGFQYLGFKIWSNIGTAYGVYFLIGGYKFAFAMATLFSSISYFIYNKFIQNPTIILVFLVCFFLTVNALSFFSLYVHLLSFYEFPFFFIFLYGIFKISAKSR